MATAKELRELSDADLGAELASAKDELFKLRFRLATGQLENTGRIQTVKRDVARANTELRVREIAAYEAGKGASK
jgi:large subunit ribosomal protein L29